MNTTTINLTPAFLIWVIVFGGLKVAGFDISWWLVAGPWLILPVLWALLFLAFLFILPKVWRGEGTVLIKGKGRYRRINKQWIKVSES